MIDKFLNQLRIVPLEVDGMLGGTWGSWALEIKTGGFRVDDLKGLAEFTRRHRRICPVVLCDESEPETARRAGMEAIPWKQFLIRGPPESRAEAMETA
jgi:hypothetical protein